MNHAETYHGTVLSLSGPGVALVRLNSIPSASGCKGCALTMVCGSKAKDRCETQVLAHISPESPLSEGQEVTLRLAPGSRASAASRLLALPLCAMGAAGTLCATAGMADWAIALASLGAGALAVTVVSFASRRESKTMWTIVSQ